MLLQLLISGLAIGATYAITALSLVLVYRAVILVNFSQGDLVMFSAFIGVVGYDYLHLSLWISCLISLVAMVFVGIGMYYASYRFLREKTFLPFIISTIAMGLILENVAGITTSFKPLALPSFFSSNAVHFLSIYIAPDKVFVIVLTLVLVVLLQLFLSRTTLGVLLQATAQDTEAARLSGVRVNRMIILTFAISGVLSGFAGLLLAPLYFVTASMGSTVILKAFAATIIGGFGSVSGAIVGGVLIGLIETFASTYISNQYASAISFGLLVITLLFFPSGIFGERSSIRV